MLVKNLLEILSKVPASSEVIIRDLNGLNWELEENDVFLEDGVLVLNSEGINIS